MKMKWVRSIKNKNSECHMFQHYYIDVERVLWDDVSIGDMVFIGGNLIGGVETVLYGRHEVVSVPDHLLLSGNGKTFNERSGYLYKPLVDIGKLLIANGAI